MENKPIPFVEYLTRLFNQSNDFVSETMEINGVVFVICYLKSLTDTSKSSELMRKIGALAESIQRGDKAVLQLEAMSDLSESEAVDAILSGRLILIHISGNLSLNSATRSILRSVDTPQSETTIQGASDAFTESLDSNIGILRMHLRSQELAVRRLEMGTIRKQAIAVCHMQSETSRTIASRIVSRLEDRRRTDAGNIQDLGRILGQRWWSPVPLFYSSELPEQAASLLLKGRVLLLQDQLPYALLAPPKITDLWIIHSDQNMPGAIAHFIQVMRVLGLLVSLLLPGLYVALVSVNPELFRIEMALSVARSREGVPYPALFEMLIMLIVIEMIVGASVRLPKSIGPTVTMVGGIILGQAAVQAQLVSNLLLIVISASIIANFTFIGIQNALMIRLFKYVIVIMGSFFGVMGVFSGLVWLIFYLSCITTFQVPYLSLNLNLEEGYE